MARKEQPQPDAKVARAQVRPTQQRRSQRSLERIVEALEDLIEEQTFEEITVSEVCKRARVAVGTFYDRVGNKDALLEHLRRRFYADIIAQIDQAFAPERFVAISAREMVTINAREMVALHRRRQGAIRATIVEARRSAAFAAHARELNRSLMDRVTTVWLSKRDALAPDQDPERLVRSAFLLAVGFLREAVIWAELWPGPTDDAQITADFERMLVHVLLDPNNTGE
jgi:AcrR family transcriptional regulator